MNDPTCCLSNGFVIPRITIEGLNDATLKRRLEDLIATDPQRPAKADGTFLGNLDYAEARGEWAEVKGKAERIYSQIRRELKQQIAARDAADKKIAELTEARQKLGEWCKRFDKKV